MSAKRKQKKNRNNSLVALFKLILTAVVIIALIFAIDYCSIKTNTRNTATEKIHETKEQIQDFANEIKNEILPPAEESVKESPVTDSKTQVAENTSLSFPENLELPLCAALKNGTAQDHQIRRFKNFTICYRESYEQAEWAAYCLEKAELEKNTKRGDNFRPDPEITTGSASLADYKKSGYDRGHLAPAADFAFSEEAMSESFFLSNMSPQAPGLNREIWQYLEGQVRLWAEEYGKAYIITGPVLEKPADQYEYIGENQVSVPEFFYKIILAPHENTVKALAFIIPNQKCEGTFWDYAVSVDEVENRTGLDFFFLLDDLLEDQLESNISKENWR